MQINPISMKKIYQRIIEQFVNLIKEGELKAGDRLPPERALAEMFNVSRASIREAFSAMEIIGLIEVRMGEGTYVTDLNIGPFINTIAPLFVENESLETDLLEFRKLIEVQAVKMAAKKHVNKDIALLENALESMVESLKKNDIALGAEADIMFHKAIFSLTGSVVLTKAAECTAYIFESSVKFNRAKILKDSSNGMVLYKQHKELLQAIKDRDDKLAGEIMERHLNFVKEII